KQGMKLNQIDGIDTQAFERAMDLLTRVLVEALTSLGSQEEILTMPCHPWANTQFSIPIAGRNIDMIAAVCQAGVQHTIRLCLGGAAERRCPKERDCAQLSSASKRSFLNHSMFLSHVCSCHILSCRQTPRDTR